MANVNFSAEAAMAKLMKIWEDGKENRKNILEKGYISELQNEFVSYEDEKFIEKVIGVLEDYQDDEELFSK
jgi:predicted RecB family nuclease